jgi:AAA family ATP:ADP antiporter
MPPSPEKRSLVERLLGIFTRVEPGEGFTVLALTLNVFVLMTAYSAIKPVREGLILSLKSGAEYKAYMGAAIAVALLGAVPVYARVADRMPRNRLVAGVTLFFAANLVAFWAASAFPAVRAQLGLVFFLWLGVFNMMVIAQFWAFANDLYREEQGKRLFPLIGVGQTVGAAVGSGIAVLLLELVGVYQMLLVSAALLVVSAALTEVTHLREVRKRSFFPGAPATVHRRGSEGPGKSAGAKAGAFEMVLKDSYLRGIAIFTVLFTIVNSNGEYMLGRLVKDAAAAAVAAGTLNAEHVKEYVGAEYSRFYFFVNIATVGLQAFVVSRFVQKAGFRVAFLFLPIIPLIDSVGVGVAPLLTLLFVGKIFENSTDYSLNNTLRNMLWLPTTREMKYKAKQAVDTFFVRLGDVTSALFVYVVAGALGLGVRGLAFTSLVACGLWFLVARGILKQREAISGSVPPPAQDAAETAESTS